VQVAESGIAGRPIDHDARGAWLLEKQKACARKWTRQLRARRKADASLEAPPSSKRTQQGELISLEHCLSRESRISQDLAREIAKFAYSRMQQYDTNI
jgi:hypothetical protein